MGKATEIRTLPVKLDDSDILEMADRASSLFKEAGRLAYEAKQAAAKSKEEVQDLKGEYAKLQGYIYNREEPRKTDCQWFINKNIKRRVLRRLDTMEVVTTRELEEEDLQMDLFKEGEEKLQEDPVTVEPENKNME